jgi:hypothetical protein
MSLLPVEPAYRLAKRSQEHRWLVTGLWSEQAVGIVGGEPKCCKSFLALDLAVAVAAGVPCLRRFAVPRAGRVLLFAAEDALHIVRRRLEGISAAASVALANLDIQVITAPTVRLDLDADRRNLAETVARLQPRLLILDPFVRLHRIDENASGEVAPLLAYLRELQRRHDVAVLVVHHAKKGGGGVRAGQALRGSSEFHAWGDSNLYLRRDGDDLSLSVEHRAAPSMTPITIELAPVQSPLPAGGRPHHVHALGALRQLQPLPAVLHEPGRHRHVPLLRAARSQLLPRGADAGRPHHLDRVDRGRRRRRSDRGRQAAVVKASTPYPVPVLRAGGAVGQLGRTLDCLEPTVHPGRSGEAFPLRGRRGACYQRRAAVRPLTKDRS